METSGCSATQQRGPIKSQRNLLGYPPSGAATQLLQEEQEVCLGNEEANGTPASNSDALLIPQNGIIQ